MCLLNYCSLVFVSSFYSANRPSKNSNSRYRRRRGRSKTKNENTDMTIAIISSTHHRVLYGDGDVVLAGDGGDGDGGGALHLQPQLARPQVGGLGLVPAQGGVCNMETWSSHI